MNVSAIDVAAYILGKLGSMPTMKLQKLVYYSQAWSLVWDDEPLFRDRIEAWANGPVVCSLYKTLRGQYKVATISDGRPELLDDTQRETIDAILEFYGSKSSHWLSDLTHMESPWKETREKAGLIGGERGQAVISEASMAEYYSSL